MTLARMPNQTPDQKALACPNCRGPLAFGPSGARCPACALDYPIAEGVLCTGRTEAFLGEFGAARMAEFTRLARDRGAATAVAAMARAHPAVESLLLGEDRASFLPLLGLDRGRKHSVLDLGAGLGAISLKLSASFGRVYAMDQTFERLAFLEAVAGQQGREAIRSVCHRNILRLPFASESLDAVVLVGVFEYFPLSFPERPIRDIQLGALREISRVLAPGGVLFLATKNRFGWPHWRGERDNSGLRFGPVLPRPLADRLGRTVMGRPLRVVTDSLGRYRWLLKESGFPEPRFYWPVGGYQTPKTWVDLDDEAGTGRAIAHYSASPAKRWLLSLLAAAGVFKYLVPHFGIVARKP